MLQRLCDSLHNCVSLRKNLVVPEADHLEAKGGQITVPVCVTLRPLRVLTSVNLYDEASLQANEVDNVGAYRPLAADSTAADLAHSEAGPEPLLCVGGVASEGPSPLGCHAPILTFPRRRGKGFSRFFARRWREGFPWFFVRR